MKSDIPPLPHHANNSIVMVAIDADAVLESLRLMAVFHRHYPRVGITVLGGDRDTLQTAAAELGGIRLPLPARRHLRKFLKIVNPGLVVFAGEPNAATESLRRAACRRGCALALIVSSAETSAPVLLQRHQADHVFINADRDPTTATACSRLSASHQVENTQIIRQLVRRQVRQIGFARRRPPAFPRIHRRLSALHFPRIESIEHLRRLLSAPQTILCLGNGPSSETPELHSQAFDCLFRVNRSWETRGCLTHPDLVFSNLHKAISVQRPRVGFVVRTGLDEDYIHWRLRWMPRRARLATAERLQVDQVPAPSAFKPSTGVLMLATAVALNPERLIVAGIDLFSDDAGAYPGDTTTVNDYTPDHDRDHERRTICTLLNGYPGELLIFGEVLKQAIEASGANGDS